MWDSPLEFMFNSARAFPVAKSDLAEGVYRKRAPAPGMNQSRFWRLRDRTAFARQRLLVTSSLGHSGLSRQTGPIGIWPKSSGTKESGAAGLTAVGSGQLRTSAAARAR